jgi:hypothetical protein
MRHPTMQLFPNPSNDCRMNLLDSQKNPWIAEFNLKRDQLVAGRNLLMASTEGRVIPHSGGGCRQGKMITLPKNQPQQPQKEKHYENETNLLARAIGSDGFHVGCQS